MIRHLAIVLAAVVLFAVSFLITGSCHAEAQEDIAVDDWVDIYQSRELSLEVANAAIAAAERAGGTGAVVRGGVLKLSEVRRANGPVQQAPPGFAYPVSSSGISPELAEEKWDEDAVEALEAGRVLLTATSAALRGASEGDVLQLEGWNGTQFELVVGAVVPDDHNMGEIIISDSTADRLGLRRPSRVILWGFDSRDEMQAQLAAGGLERPGVRIRRSWDLPDPDETLSTAEFKAELGEFWYKSEIGRTRCSSLRTRKRGRRVRVCSRQRRVIIDSEWMRSELSDRRLLNDEIRLSARCHNVVFEALRNAMKEVEANGLEGTINVRTSNRYGGCWAAREVRDLGSTTGGFLSRHSWGGAIDINVTTNRIGREPTLDCRVVRIFRKWGFAWGGNFTTPDGMHFEWVGERRDLWPYPSRRCANMVPVPEGSWPRKP